MHSLTGRSTGIAKALPVTLGKCKHLLSLVGASASLGRPYGPPGRSFVYGKFLASQKRPRPGGKAPGDDYSQRACGPSDTSQYRF